MLCIIVTIVLPIFVVKTPFTGPLPPGRITNTFFCWWCSYDSSLFGSRWFRIVFEIVSPLVASQAGLPANTELDIKVIDDPSKVVDVKQTVLSLIKVPQAQRDLIEIVDVEYSIVCTQGGTAGAAGASASASAVAVAVAVATIVTNQTNQTTPTHSPVNNVTLLGPCPSLIGLGTNDTLSEPTFTCPDGTVVASKDDCAPVPEPEPEPEMEVKIKTDQKMRGNQKSEG